MLCQLITSRIITLNLKKTVARFINTQIHKFTTIANVDTGRKKEEERIRDLSKSRSNSVMRTHIHSALPVVLSIFKLEPFSADLKIRSSLSRLP